MGDIRDAGNLFSIWWTALLLRIWGFNIPSTFYSKSHQEFGGWTPSGGVLPLIMCDTYWTTTSGLKKNSPTMWRRFWPHHSSLTNWRSRQFRGFPGYLIPYIYPPALVCRLICSDTTLFARDHPKFYYVMPKPRIWETVDTRSWRKAICLERRHYTVWAFQH